MTWMNTMIPKRSDPCGDCIVLDGQTYCTMNCGPRVEATAGKPCNPPAVMTPRKTRIDPSATHRLAAKPTRYKV